MDFFKAIPQDGFKKVREQGGQSPLNPLRKYKLWDNMQYAM